MVTAAEFRAHTAATMSEAELQTKIIQLAKVHGWMCFHPRNMIGSEPGWPDLTLAKAGRLIFAELKSEKGKTTTAQDRWLQVLGTTNDTYVWRPTSLLSGEILEVLR